MSAAIAISSMAAAQASVAAREATESRKASCTTLVQSYKNTGDVEAAKQYSSCVQLLYPNTTHEFSTTELKVVVGGLIVGVFVGAVMAKRNQYYGDLADIFMGGLGGLLGAMVIELVLAGILFVFS